MKIAMLVCALVGFVTVALMACPKNYVEYKGNCAYEPAPADSGTTDMSKWVSDEKPPRTTTGEWQTGKFKVILIPSQDSKTEIDDQIKFAQAKEKP
jgi:hypothetical protein